MKNEPIIIDDDVTVEMDYNFGKPEDKIVLTKEVCIPGNETNYYSESEIILNRTDAIKLMEFIQANLDRLNDD